MRKVTPVRPALGSVLLAGGVASSGFLVTQAVDQRLTGGGYDDLLLWGGLLSRDPARQRLLGAGVHFALGVALAAIYDALLPLLPDLPGPVRGMLFAQVENTLAYPGVPWINRRHPEVRSGRLASLTSPRYWLLETIRHAVYGALLGTLLPGRGKR